MLNQKNKKYISHKVSSSQLISTHAPKQTVLFIDDSLPETANCILAPDAMKGITPANKTPIIKTVPYASVSIVLNVFIGMGLRPQEYEPVSYELPGTWKVKIKGSLESYNEQQRAFLSNGFTVKFAGDSVNKFTWIWFHINGANETASGGDAL